MTGVLTARNINFRVNPMKSVKNMFGSYFTQNQYIFLIVDGWGLNGWIGIGLHGWMGIGIRIRIRWMDGLQTRFQSNSHENMSKSHFNPKFKIA